eukprot:gnl/TRDRNA2_/TRDRNA2_174167_c0_seq3.p1 gnl/TRDRNA2_/TRDRNA2_174167_c0~~gnl/TRDRNA2_/TRDRNA2_174167_c0_seq3.p1  ORF type:complete len:243 (+),score=32.07 gnl/TRDRNA2_/TRDRNA2_174167_c0_seq3:68-796(+)
MRWVSLILLVTFVAPANARGTGDAEDSTSSLVGRALEASPTRNADLDATVLGKHANIAMPTSQVSARSAIPGVGRSVPGGFLVARQFAKPEVEAAALRGRSGAADAMERRGAMALAAAMMLSNIVLPSPSYALGAKKGTSALGSNKDVFAEQMAAINARKEAGATPTMSVDSLYQDSGGACGQGYKLVVGRDTGCVCIDPENCPETSVSTVGVPAKPTAPPPPVKQGANDPSKSGVTITFAK